MLGLALADPFLASDCVNRSYIRAILRNDNSSPLAPSLLKHRTTVTSSSTRPPIKGKDTLMKKPLKIHTIIKLD
jgi:hypothetical protein